MGRIAWYKRDPLASLDGMRVLSLEERGAYNTVLDLIYSRDGNLPDDDRFICGWLGVDLRIWKRIKARLITLGKLYVRDGLLGNARADAVVHDALAKVVATSQAGRSQPRKSVAVPLDNNGLAGADDRQTKNKNKTLEPSTSETPTPPEPPPEPEQQPSLAVGKPASRYAWQGQVIQLTERDLERWRAAAPDVDLQAYLFKRDLWLADLEPDDPRRKKWFVGTGTDLANHQIRMAAERKAPSPPIDPRLAARIAESNARKLAASSAEALGLEEYTEEYERHVGALMMEWYNNEQRRSA